MQGRGRWLNFKQCGTEDHTEEVAFEDDLKATWQEDTTGERNSKYKGRSMPGVSKEEPAGQSREQECKRQR